MSQNNSILNLLEIEDQNIKIQKVDTTIQNNEKVKLIYASLSYPVERCTNCGFKSVVKKWSAQNSLALRQP